jgi:hypothetical protein
MTHTQTRRSILINRLSDFLASENGNVRFQI